MAIIENNKLEVVKAIESVVESIKENCQAAFDDVKEARVSGSKNAQDLVANFKFNDKADETVAKVAGYMGEMIGTGFSMLICPVKIMERNINKVTAK
jgi:preprotein translocase subunit SecD